MEENEIHNILFKLDSDNGRKTKLRILRILSKGNKNASEISNLLGMKSYSHINKFLKILREIYLVDYIEKSFDGEYRRGYIKREYYLTDMGIDVINGLKDILISEELTPQMFIEKIKRSIRSSDKYKNWKRDVIRKNGNKCVRCGIWGDCIQVHHIVSFKDILIKNNISTVEGANNCEELWNIKNGKCLCSCCHIELHINGNKI